MVSAAFLNETGKNSKIPSLGRAFLEWKWKWKWLQSVLKITNEQTKPEAVDSNLAKPETPNKTNKSQPQLDPPLAKQQPPQQQQQKYNNIRNNMRHNFSSSRNSKLQAMQKDSAKTSKSFFVTRNMQDPEMKNKQE